MITIIILLALFGIKHFVCDFVLQNGRMLREKGVYLAPGGLQHALEHAVGTTVVLFVVLPWGIYAHLSAVLLGLIDGVIHYHIDWVKTRLTQGYTAQDREFWILLGADQGLHYLTYVGIIAVVVLL